MGQPGVTQQLGVKQQPGVNTTAWGDTQQPGVDTNMYIGVSHAHATTTRHALHHDAVQSTTTDSFISISLFF